MLHYIIMGLKVKNTCVYPKGKKHMFFIQNNTHKFLYWGHWHKFHLGLKIIHGLRLFLNKNIKTWVYFPQNLYLGDLLGKTCVFLNLKPIIMYRYVFSFHQKRYVFSSVFPFYLLLLVKKAFSLCFVFSFL